MMAHRSVVTPHEAILLLRSGFVVAIPTETVYGLAASLWLPSAIKKIFEVKNRPLFDPLIVHIPKDYSLWSSLVQGIPSLAQALADAFWPGPLTLVLPKSSQVDPIVTAHQETVAIRCPNHPVTLEILEKVGPLCAPSANPFGKTSPVKAQHVLEYFQSKIPVVDGGQCQLGIESTILWVASDGYHISILRKGLILKKDIENVLNQKCIAFRWLDYAPKDTLPGMLPHHYQPLSPLKIYLINPQNTHVIPEPQNLFLPTEDPIQCARQLYATLIEESQKWNSLVLYWPKTHIDGLWEPIWEKLQKAATNIIHFDS